jgi:predicted RNase H-like HicB family nuclease
VIPPTAVALSAAAYCLYNGAMLTRYIQAAMAHAHYELLADGEGYYGQIPELSGVWGQAETLEACRQQLQDALEGWILLRVRFGRSLPEIDGILIQVSTEQVSEVA